MYNDFENEQLVANSAQPVYPGKGTKQIVVNGFSIEDPDSLSGNGEGGGRLCNLMSACVQALRTSFQPIISFVSREGSEVSNSDDLTVTEALVRDHALESHVTAGRCSFNPPRTRSGRTAWIQGTSTTDNATAKNGDQAVGEVTTAGEGSMGVLGPLLKSNSAPKPGASVDGFDSSHSGGSRRNVAEMSTTDIIHNEEGRREMLHKREKLSAILDRLEKYLPVRVEVESDVQAKDGGNSLQSRPDHLCLQVLGPLRTTPHSAVLGLLEDILLEDCVPTSLRISSIHFADVSFSGEAAAGMQSVRQPDSVASLDALPTFGVVTTKSGSSDPIESERLKKECTERFCAFAKNVLECYSHITSVRLTRCCFTPSDLGRWLKLPLLQLKFLYFEKCPLSAAHVDALIRLARAVSRQSDRGQAFQRLEELQLSGSLTEESVCAVLSYFNDELLEGEIALVSLRLPSLWLRVARSHPILERQPSLVISST